MDKILNYDVVIVGGGCAGMAAAIELKKQGINRVLLIEKDRFLGGILGQCIHNGFGLHTFKEQLSGPEFAERYIDMIHELKIDYRLESHVLSITKDKDVYYSNYREGFVHIKAQAIIIATGSIERTAGSIMLAGERPSGIMTAGMAQKYLNIDGYLVGKKVFILGSGDIGLIMARRLTLEGAEVLGVAEIMPYSSGLTRNIVQCLDDFNIPLYLSHSIKEVIGENRVEKVIVAKVDDNLNFITGSEIEFTVDTLILSVGLLPYNLLLEAIDVEMGKTKGAVVDNNYQTNIEGIFVCGNALHIHDLADYVVSEAGLTANGVIRYLNRNNENKKTYNTIPMAEISYIVPQKFMLNCDEINFKFRVKKPFANVYLEIIQNGLVIKRIKKAYLLPAEMAEINLKTSMMKEADLGLRIVGEN